MLKEPKPQATSRLCLDKSYVELDLLRRSYDEVLLNCLCSSS